jgi:hypothetical protein
MRITLHELMEKLGVPHTLSAYETWPFATMDALSGKTCSAEVRMSPDCDEVEAEIQLVEDDESDMGSADSAGVQQLFWLIATPFKEEKWAIKGLRIKSEDWVGKVFNWEEKACNLFRAITHELARGQMPDFDEIMEKEMKAKDRYGDQRGGGAGKSPIIRPGQLLDMKKGAGF